jgi:hypothetical protein
VTTYAIIFCIISAVAFVVVAAYIFFTHEGDE